MEVVHRRVLNTIKLYAKQRRLVAMVTNQVFEKEKNSRMLISVLSEIVEFRNGESGMHAVSYTHLDVYKRQQYNGALGAALMAYQVASRQK